MGAVLLLTLLFSQVSQRPPCDVAADETYAYTKERSVQVGGSPLYGASRQKRYLDTLRGPEGQVVTWKRLGQDRAPDGTIIDAYQVTYEGLEKPVTLYLDWYHYNPILAPRGFSCAGPFNIGPPPLDPFKESDHLQSLAIEQGAARDFDPIPLVSDGVTHGAMYDRFRLIALASRAAAKEGRTLDHRKLPPDLQKIGMVIVSYPATCEGRTLPPAGIVLAGPTGGPYERETKGNLPADAVARLLPGVQLPSGTVAVSYPLRQPRPNDSLVFSYMEDGCGVSGNVRRMSLTVSAARGVTMPNAIFPEGVTDPGPPMLLQVLIDTDGKVQRPEYVGGALPLVEAAKASLSRWQVEPARVNGAPVVSGVVLQVRFGPK